MHGGRFYFVWHIPALGQFTQPQPQELLLFFLSRTIFMVTAASTSKTTAPTRMVGRLFRIKLNIQSYLSFQLRSAAFVFVSAQQHVNEACQKQKCDTCEQSKPATTEQQPKLVDNE